MANILFINILPRRIATLYNKLKYTTSKIQKTASSIGFIDQALRNNFTPKFAKVVGQFINQKDQLDVERKLLNSHLHDHKRKLKTLCEQQDEIATQIQYNSSKLFQKLIFRYVYVDLSKENYIQLNTKVRKIKKLKPIKTFSYSVPIVNISTQDLNTEPLKFGLHHCFVDKNKYTKQNIAMEMENVATNADKYIADVEKENFHNFLRSSTNIFTKNILQSKDQTFKKLNALRNNKTIVVLSADKESCSIILDRVDYIKKVDNMILEGIKDKKYTNTEDTILKDLKNFQSFLYRNFKDHEKYKDMYPTSHQASRFFSTAKTHKFENINDINLKDLKLRPIIDQTGSCFYNASQVLSKYLQPLSDNQYNIKDTLTFASSIKEQKLDFSEEDVSYDAVSLFTSIPVQDTIKYICDEIYRKNSIPSFHKKELIFKNLLTKLATNCIFSFNNVLYKQIEGCTMGGPLSVVLANIFLTKMEKDIISPHKPIFYKRYVDDIYVRRKKDINDTLFEKINKFHSNIKFTIEKEPKKFLDTEIIKDNNNEIQTKVYRKTNCLPANWDSKTPKRYKRNAINIDLHRAKSIATDFQIEVKRITQKYLNAGYPQRFIMSVINDFDNKKDNEMIIPEWLFNPKPSLTIFLPYSPENEIFVKRFLTKLNIFTNDACLFMIIWRTRNIKSLFSTKDKVSHISNVIYSGQCSCGESYIGETDRNVDIRWKEHNNPSHRSNPSKHLTNNIFHEFQWKTIKLAPKNNSKRKILEAFFISRYKPKLNNQVEMRQLLLFKNGI